jgi:integrase/recombinase XerD
LVIGLLYGCGLGNYELCNLEQKDLDFERKTVFVKKQKGNTDRYVPLCEMLMRGLKNYLPTENPYRWVFNSQGTKDGKILQFTQAGVGWSIKEAKAKLGIKKQVTAAIFVFSKARPPPAHLLKRIEVQKATRKRKQKKIS